MKLFLHNDDLSLEPPRVLMRGRLLPLVDRGPERRLCALLACLEPRWLEADEPPTQNKCAVTDSLK